MRIYKLYLKIWELLYTIIFYPVGSYRVDSFSFITFRPQVFKPRLELDLVCEDSNASVMQIVLRQSQLDSHDGESFI
jgi:hypothetical protein